MSLIHNERTKLTATLLNNVAAAMFITGGVGPIVALSYGLPGPTGGGGAWHHRHLDSKRIRHTLHGKAASKRIEAMTAAMLAWYVAPLLLLAACYGLYLAARDHGHHAGPAE